MSYAAHAAEPPAGPHAHVLRIGLGRIGGLSCDVQLAVLSVVAFIGVTIWWLMQEGRVQDWDNGLHTIEAFGIRDEIANGHLTTPFTEFNTYPPFGHIVGALGELVGPYSP